MQKRLIAGVTGAALAAGMGLGMTTLAHAETDSPTPSPSPSTSTSADDTRPTNRTGEFRGTGSPRMASRSTDHVADLARKLDLPQERVSEALTAVREEAQATRPSTGFTDRDDRDAAREQRRSAIVDALAEELGINRTTLSTAMSELRAENHASRESNRAAKLDEAVNNGKVTQEEADAIQKAMDSGVLAGRGHGGGHGRR